MELPQTVISEFARYLVPVIRKFYEDEENQREFDVWMKTQSQKSAKES